MTKENLERANILKDKIISYNRFLDFFKPLDYTVSAAIPGMPPEMYPIPTPPPVINPKISLTANYIPGVISTEGTTDGKWEVASASGVTDQEILSAINTIASAELSNIGGTIVTSILEKITEMQTEFDNL